MRVRSLPALLAAHVAAVTSVMAFVTACADYTLKAQGEECFASSECEQGLLCDFGVTPHVCSPTQTDASPVDAYVPPPPDAAPQPDAPPHADGGGDIDAATTIDAASQIDAPSAPDAAPPIDSAPPVDAEVPDAEPEIDAEAPDAA